MTEGNRRVHPGPRLGAAADMLAGSRVTADIGCDHGRLLAVLLQRDAEARCIGVDVSAPSLEKARRLFEKTGLSDRAALRLGDGFSALSPGEADAAALLGMGGTLMARLLDACPVPFCGAARIVCQPMRTAADIRAWLYAHRCPILDDRVVREGGRLYQVFSAAPPADAADALPDGWPADCFSLGYRAFAKRDPLLPALARLRKDQCEKRLRAAGAGAGAKEKLSALRREAERMRAILSAYGAEEGGDTACD